MTGDALEGRVVVVTGATGSIGTAICRTVAEAGARVVAVGRDRAALTALADGSGTAVIPVAADLSAEAGVAQLAAVAADLGQVDGLVHAIGVHRTAPIERVDAAHVDLHLRANVWAPVLTTVALLPLLERSRGRVVFLGSSAARHPRAGVAIYAASKAALHTFAAALRDEVADAGVRVAVVVPGRTAGRLQEELHAEEGRPYRPRVLLAPEDVARSVLHILTAPPTAEITEVVLRPHRR